MKKTTKSLNNIKILIWIIFIIIPINIIVLFVYIFANYIYPMIDPVIFTFDISFSYSLGCVIAILFVPIIFFEMLTLLFNRISMPGKKKQLYDALLCLIWILELIMVGLLNYIILISYLNSNESSRNYFIMYYIFCIPTGLFLFIKLIYHYCRHILLNNNNSK